MSDQALAVKTIKNSILNIASFLIGLLVNFYLLRYVVSQIGIEAYGISALLLVIVAPLTLANLGFGEATTKYVAEYMHRKEHTKAGAFIRTTLFMNLLIGVGGGGLVFFFGGKVVMWAFSSQINHTYDELVTDCMRVVAFGWLFNQCSAAFMGVPVALQRFRLVALGNLIFVLVSAVSTYILISKGWGLLGYTIATVTGQLGGLLFWIYSARQLLPDVSILPVPDKAAWKKSFHFGGWQTLSQLGGLLAQQAEKYVMGVLLSIASVGVYNVALNIEQKIYAMVHKLSEVLFPMFSALSNETADRKANILIKSTWITTSLAVSLLVSVIPFAHPLINLWMKNTTLADLGEPVLQTICLAGAFGSATTAGYFFLLGVGKTQKITYISILTGVVTVVSAAIILPFWGLKGAGWSALIAAAVQSVAITRVMYTALKDTVSLSSIFTAVFAPILSGAALSLIVLVLLDHLFKNWLELGIGYALMFMLSVTVIFFTTRMMPHGKEHEELLKKLYFHTINKFRKRFSI